MSVCNLILLRSYFTETNTIGRLYLNSTFFCYTFEKKDRGLNSNMQLVDIEHIKVPGQTCIPYGEYSVMINLSVQYGKISPLIKQVPSYGNIRILPELEDIITDGCIILGSGFNKRSGSLIDTNTAFVHLMSELKNYPNIMISIRKNTAPEYV